MPCHRGLQAHEERRRLSDPSAVYRISDARTRVTRTRVTRTRVTRIGPGSAYPGRGAPLEQQHKQLPPDTGPPCVDDSDVMRGAAYMGDADDGRHVPSCSNQPPAGRYPAGSPRRHGDGAAGRRRRIPRRGRVWGGTANPAGLQPRPPPPPRPAPRQHPGPGAGSGTGARRGCGGGWQEGGRGGGRDAGCWDDGDGDGCGEDGDGCGGDGEWGTLEVGEEAWEAAGWRRYEVVSSEARCSERRESGAVREERAVH